MSPHNHISGKTSDKPHSHEELYRPSVKRGIYIFFSRLMKTLWWLFVAAIVIEIVLTAMKMNESRPQERLCFDASGCYEYCASFSGAQCTAPEFKDTAQSSDAWHLLLTGKRTLIEVLNENQGYCSCTYQVGGENRIETFYQFYADPITDY